MTTESAKAKEANIMREYNGRYFGKKPLVQLDYYYVMISHQELDDLVATLMHVLELDSDKEHREAMKGEVKMRVRRWLDEQYREAGWENFDLVPGARIVNVESLRENIYTGKQEAK